jgi:uncharacterized protein YjbI with pentapeptide repeats
MKIEIKSRFSEKLIFGGEFASLKLAIEYCVRAGINLDGASLFGASLDRASLDGARLDGARLDGARLDGARLVGASLVGASLDRASLDGAPFAVKHLDAKILAAIEANQARIASDPELEGKDALKMSAWHYCEMSHCRGGYAVLVAGEAGRSLEFTVGPTTAANLIYAASRPKLPMPDFYASDEDAMADITACAAADPIPEIKI